MTQKTTFKSKTGFDAAGQTIENIGTPVNEGDAISKEYFDANLPSFSSTNKIYVSDIGNDTTGNGNFDKPYLTITKALDYTNPIITKSGDTQSSNVILISDTSNIVKGSKIKGSGILDNTVIIDIIENTSITISNDTESSLLSTSLHILDESLIVVSGKHEISTNIYKDGVSYYFEPQAIILNNSNNSLFLNTNNFYYNINVFGGLKYIASASNSFYSNSGCVSEFNCYNYLEFDEVNSNGKGIFSSLNTGSSSNYLQIKGDIISNASAIDLRDFITFSIESNIIQSNLDDAIYTLNSLGSEGSSNITCNKVIAATGNYALNMDVALNGQLEVNINNVSNDVKITSNYNATAICNISGVNNIINIYGTDSSSTFLKGVMGVVWNSSCGNIENSGNVTVNGGRVAIKNSYKYTNTTNNIIVNSGVCVIDETYASQVEYLTVNGGKCVTNTRLKKLSGNDDHVKLTNGELWVYGEIDTQASSVSLYSINQTGGTLYLMNGGNVKNSLTNGTSINSSSGTVIINGGEVSATNGLGIRFPYNSSSNIKILSSGLTANDDKVFSGNQKTIRITVSTITTTSLSIFDSNGSTNFSETGASLVAIAANLVASINLANKKYQATDNLNGTFDITGTDTSFYPISTNSLVNVISTTIINESIPKLNDVSDLTFYDTLPKRNISLIDPTISDDSTLGYSIGSRWINTDTDIEFVCTNSTSSAANWVDTSQQASSGGHEIKENGVVFSARSGLNYKTNGTPIITDDAANNETEIELKYEANTDVDTTSIQDGDLMAYESVTGIHKPKSVKVFDDIRSAPEANLDSDTELSIFIEAGYKITSMTITENSGFDAGNISIGTTALGNDVVNTNTILANDDKSLTLLKDYFSRVNDTTLFISSSAWGSGKVTVYITVIKL